MEKKQTNKQHQRGMRHQSFTPNNQIFAVAAAAYQHPLSLPSPRVIHHGLSRRIRRSLMTKTMQSKHQFVRLIANETRFGCRFVCRPNSSRSTISQAVTATAVFAGVNLTLSTPCYRSTLAGDSRDESEAF
ncbi:hypothetical protein Ddye_029554 [Dipteronia dyeriana]|uniref:Uncharacterized protein n=1 Tax=Dipteronia dyeriana TaxID=168575 RepID=A0AAD9TET0_9ROSI|nr:hypothetical protein Ddye_029554 [Dipteronia dyeriana]